MTRGGFAQWAQFVERRSRELDVDYPCAQPGEPRSCPRHGLPVGPISGICKPCRDELYAQLAAEYVGDASAGRTTT